MTNEKRLILKCNDTGLGFFKFLLGTIWRVTYLLGKLDVICHPKLLIFFMDGTVGWRAGGGGGKK